MDTLTHNYVDKSKWPQGEWQDEPDKVQWQDEMTGLACLVVRGPVGALCGYVGVTEQHPWYGRGYSDDALDGVRVHGGLTFADASQKDERGISAAGVPEKIWWFGFDCAHSGDACPKYGRGDFLGMGVYRNLDYVKSECRLLASQLEPAQEPTP